LVIRNIPQLSTTKLRADALAIAEAGYQAINLERVFTDRLHLQSDVLTVGGHSFNLSKYERIYVVGVGKGSSIVARTIERILGSNRLSAGYVIDNHPIRLTGTIKAFKGTHPLPSQQNIDATEEIVKLLHQATSRDLVITIVCGGGSALFCKPGDRTCLELQFIGSHMLRSGASIHEMNTVRKHVSRIHGGHMAMYAYPATILALMVSDVPGDDLDVIASGPTVRDTTTRQDAQRVAAQFKLPEIPFYETPKDQKYFRKVTNVVIASGSLAVDAMADKARELGYDPIIYDRDLKGLAKDVGPKLAAIPQPGQVALACGETEVHVTHTGRGGRNQDVALSAIAHLSPNGVLVSAASDGADNEPVAGGIVDGQTSARRCHELGLDPNAAVMLNDSYPVLHALGDHLHTRPGNANVADFMVSLRGR
jgi:glycerate 2-kinase